MSAACNALDEKTQLATCVGELRSTVGGAVLSSVGGSEIRLRLRHLYLSTISRIVHFPAARIRLKFIHDLRAHHRWAHPLSARASHSCRRARGHRRPMSDPGTTSR